MTQYHLHLKGYVGGADFNSESVLATLAANPDAEVSVLVDSTGGQLATALSISSAFHRHGKVHVHFTGMNASAATISSLGAQRISMDASALYLVHKCSMTVFEWASMNADQLQEYIDGLAKQKTNLEKMDSNVAAMYAARCRKPQADLMALMKTGGWLTAKEAHEWGFVDDITDYEEDIKPLMTEALASALATACIPIPAIPYAETAAEGNGSEQPNEPLFARFMAAIASLFKVAPHALATSDNHNSQKEMKHFTLVEAALKVKDGFTANAEGQVLLTEEQLQTIEDALQAHETNATNMQTQVTDLQGQVSNLTTQNTDLTTKNTGLQAQVTTLTEQVNALKGTPAAKSQSVVNAQHGEDENHSAEADDYLTNLSAAKELYDLVGG